MTTVTDVTSRPKNPSDIKDIAITPLTLPATSGRMLGLPTVGRLAYFAQHPGPVVLLTTAERLEQFSKLQAFGTPASINPDLTTWADKHPHVVVDVAHALTNFPDNPDGYNLVLTHGERYGRDALLDTLVTFGYERDAWPGFIVRGDTITLYFDEDDETDSLKLEFFGDELDTITHQGEACDSYKVQPLASAELAVEDGEQVWTTRLLEHLPGQILLDSGELVNGELGSDAAAHWFWEHLAEREVVSFGRDELDLEVIESPLEPLSYYRAKLTEFATDVEMWLKDGYSVSLLLKFERTGRYLRERVLDQLETAWHSQLAHRPGKVSLIVGNAASGGYRNTSTGDIVLTEDLLYGYQGTRKLKRLPGHAVNDASALTIGDYLVHPDHGIGKFMGLEPRQVVGVTRDYLILQYSGEGKLYLPVEQLPLLRRHPGTSDDPPRLSTLGTNEWARARERARVNAQAMAAELIKTYAKRQVASGVALAAVDDWDELIGANCPFDLTDDQREAVRQTWDDMAKTIPMDRLISGDVGFGKTEVAIRAAHRAVGNSKQVAMLVPTTVLAKQHLETFQSRFAGLPVRVAMLSRFATDKEARTIVKELADGTLDIVVGTHRLLNENIKFKDLGLLIIDEEHRFGVGQKERMKGLKANLDILSLSATPIPRTLYMSLVGLRDVSQIMTPPQGRKPIQTVLQPYDPRAIRDAMLFELERGGKIFYIHDRIGSMGTRTLFLNKLVPEARVGVAHGQMNASELEEVMLGFEEGAFDVLLATTIVESGLDIGSANTLIIERADRLGLAQLYQLRGRVGRRQTEAWAHLFYPGKLTEQAQRRLYAIAELNDLGSGHLLAEKDMEIRGIGNLLGPEQHGHISAVSLEVYTEMLAEAIAELKGEQHQDKPKVAIDLSIDARLSPSYIGDDDTRIRYYGRLSEATTLSDVSALHKELRHRYGPMPAEVSAFVALVKLRLLALKKGVATITEHMTDVQVAFAGDSVDYDAKGLRELKHNVEPTRFPPGFSLKKRGLKPDKLVQALTDMLYLCA